MAKKKIQTELYSYGIYTNWDRNSRALPKLLKITEQIPLELDIEFGYVIKIKGAKGKRITFKIDHPPFTDENGRIAPPFTGEYFVRSNDYEFFLGDTIWEPIHNKKGEWKLTTWLEGELLIQKSLYVKEP
ncbi:DUF3859 domain-containing protein [Plebeiibacterium marinum]|uniref:DUF3859 domain-containing protein n=1 Tax=Plebeiibacterium marinum TaxID=2992111 RepID=A0AAE3SL71_9BACT|nr:DUF3859 domain-containing protein [Plebeiobacterium marinum]MCW3807293.1 DUF3859 domain-containing protein [Plebeiobacterium marinum]